MAHQKICGKCGKELKCLKTGLTIHYEHQPPGFVFAADLHGCKCGNSLIFANCTDYHTERKPDCVVIDNIVFYSTELFEMWDRHYPDWDMTRMFTPKAVLGLHADE